MVIIHVPVHVPVHVHAAHHRCVCMFMCINAGMPDCPASDQSSTGLKKTNDAWTGPVPDQAKAIWHIFGSVLD
jgi:hypothetical protein